MAWHVVGYEATKVTRALARVHCPRLVLIQTAEPRRGNERGGRLGGAAAAPNLSVKNT